MLWMFPLYDPNGACEGARDLSMIGCRPAMKNSSPPHKTFRLDADRGTLMNRSAAINLGTRRQAERQIMELLDLNTKIVARAPVGIIVYAASGECVLANPGSAIIVGGTVEDVMNHPFTELRFWRETGLLQAAKVALATGTTRNESVHVATSEGRDLWLDCDLVPFTTGGNLRLLYIMTDVTAQRLVEIELGEAKHVAEQASQAKSEFLANMSHEIRTPMTAIMGFTSLLEEAPLESRERDYVAKIKMSAASLLGLLNDVLDFSKIEAGRLELELTPFSLQDVMRSISVIVGANAALKNLEVVYDMAGDVPDGLTGDPLRLQQILLNLAGNAVKFTTEGEVVLAVRKVDVQPGRVELEFLIRDTGIGIEPQTRDRLFRAFSQADASTTRKFGGSGLGLAISSRLAALMGGTISVSSTLGRGSEFRFIAWFGEAPEAVEPRRAFDGLEGLEVLVVDDNETARRVLVRACETFGWHVSVAASAKEGLEGLRLASARPRPLDVLLLDWRMPEMDGLEMLRLAKDDPAVRVPHVVLMVSVSDTGEVRRQASGIRIDRVLAKPATPSTVFDAVAQLRSSGTAEPHHPKRPGMYGRLRGIRLLVVEDNEVNQQVALAILRRANAEVKAVNSGEAAVNLLREKPAAFDAVLMDVQMPGMNGYETTRIIRGVPGLNALPIIAMTANAMASDREDAHRAGMNDHVAKPIDVEEMFSVLHKWVGPSHDAEPEGAPAEAEITDLPDKLPGIDIRQGLIRAIGQSALYRQLLRDLASSHTGDAERIASSLKSGDRKGVLDLAHLLRGVAGNLGVNRVAAAAGALEGAIRLEDSVRYQGLVGELSLSLREALGSIGQLERMASETQNNNGISQDREAASAVIRTLTAELKCNDAGALLTLDRLIPLTGCHAPALEPLETAVQALEFEQALIELERLAPKLGIQP
jgi:signal transduction histidine kinase/CheY-like chemotaxis protein